LDAVVNTEKTMPTMTNGILNLDAKSPEHGLPYTLEPGARWTVFGPCEADDPVPKKADLTTVPKRLRLGRRTLAARPVRKPAGALDLGAVFGRHAPKLTGYAYIPFTVSRAGQYRLGIGADWWLQAWVDGTPVLDTLQAGNGAHPPAREDRAIGMSLAAGAHLLVVRVLSGKASMTLDVGVPRMTPAESYRLRCGNTPQVVRPLKVVFIGAGSGFLAGLFTDILCIPGTDRGEIGLVDLSPDSLQLAAKLCARILESKGRTWKITANTDRRKVLPGADYVVICIDAPGSRAPEYLIPLKYGVDQHVGDTIGPGGLFKGMRNAPHIIGILQDVERFCPQARVLNYTNPMSILCLVANRATQASIIGLCHSVQKTSGMLANWCGVPYHELKWACAGVNHLAWFTELSHRGRDLYPALKRRVAEEKGFGAGERVRLDLMMHFGYFMTESSGHDSEYVPYYRKRADTLRAYCGEELGGRKKYFENEYKNWHKNRVRGRAAQLAGAIDLPTHRGVEYASAIIEGIETNQPAVVHGSVLNRGLITNLPQDGVVEVACAVDRLGIQPIRHGELPPQCAALSAAHMRFYDLAARACLERSRDAALHAVLLDPLTAAVCSTAEIRRMVDELFEAEKDYLPKYR
jgi:alpha-galactosidase